jgi:hypothetical protein
MPYQVVIKSEARDDVAAAYDYYESRQPGLGQSFLEAFEARCTDLCENPTHYSYISEDPKGILRDIKLSRFPYVLVFEIISTDVIVYAVHCTYTDPENKLRKV